MITVRDRWWSTAVNSARSSTSDHGSVIISGRWLELGSDGAVGEDGGVHVDVEPARVVTQRGGQRRRDGLAPDRRGVRRGELDPDRSGDTDRAAVDVCGRGSADLLGREQVAEPGSVQ